MCCWYIRSTTQTKEKQNGSILLSLLSLASSSNFVRHEHNGIHESNCRNLFTLIQRKNKMAKFSFSGSLIRAGNNAKTIKGDAVSEYVTAILYLAPADLSGFGNVCPMAILAGCKEGCLNLAGMGIYSNVQKARINKTIRWFQNKDKFLQDLYLDITKFVAKCGKANRLPAIRLNGTSDIQFENYPINGFKNIFEAFPNVQFYDYTKIVKRAYKTLPSNYHLTLSYSEANAKYANSVIDAHCETGINIAVVVRNKAQAQEYIALKNSPTISGDETDLRFFDKSESIVVLYAKGKAKKDQSGFVIDNPATMGVGK
jgi:hypothetical protein